MSQGTTSVSPHDGVQSPQSSTGVLSPHPASGPLRAQLAPSFGPKPGRRLRGLQGHSQPAL